MTKNEIIEKIVYPTIKKASATIPHFYLENLTDSIVLYGKTNAILDSLNLVSFVFLLEDEIEAVCNKKIVISTEDVLNTDFPPFANISNLSQFIAKKIENLT